MYISVKPPLTLQETVVNWVGYTELAEHLQQILSTVERKLTTEEVEILPTDQLTTQLKQAQVT